jgi:hypothetical protein
MYQFGLGVGRSLLSRPFNRTYLEWANDTRSPHQQSRFNAAEQGIVEVRFGEISQEYSPLHIEYFPYNNTDWSLHRYTDSLVGLGSFNRFILRFGTQEIDVHPNDFKYNPNDSTIWTLTPPLLTTYRRREFISAAEIAKFNTTAAVLEMDCDEIRDPATSIIIRRENCTEVFAPHNINVFDENRHQPSLIYGRKDKYGNSFGWELVEYHTAEEFGAFRTSDIGFWRLHIAPEVWFFRRMPDGNRFPLMDGEIFELNSGDTIFPRWSRTPQQIATWLEDGVDELGILDDGISIARQFREARRFRQDMAEQISQHGLGSADEVMEANAWLNPILSEAFSTIISVSFRGDVNVSDVIFLDSQDSESPHSSQDFFYTHTPPRMYRVIGNGDIATTRAAIQLHARNHVEEEQARNLTECPDWMGFDKHTSTYIFPPITNDINDTLPHRIRATHFRYFWGLNTETNKMGLIPLPLDDAIFMYNGCPIDVIPYIGATPMELRRYIHMPIPTSTLEAAQTAHLALTTLRNRYLRAPDDINVLSLRIRAAGDIVSALEQTYERLRAEYRLIGEEFPTNRPRPRAWIDDCVIQRMLTSGGHRCERCRWIDER